MERAPAKQMPPRDLLDLERLIYRRQFILGPQNYCPNKYWKNSVLDQGLHLSVHVDLEQTIVRDGNSTLVLLGTVVDALDPAAAASSIAARIIASVRSVSDLIQMTMSLVGRWVAIYQCDEGTRLITDPCGFRQVYWYKDASRGVWCASQPELINACSRLNPTKDEFLLDFLKYTEHANQESAWVGASTLYEGCAHLLPNHYLHLEAVTQYRFFPNRSTSGESRANAVEFCAMLLQGAIAGLTNRYNLTLALTAGWDSRVLLAASKLECSKIKFFVFRHAGLHKNHPDLWVPRELAERLNLNFRVITPPDRLPGWFISALATNVTCARVLPKTSNIYYWLLAGGSDLNVNGNGSEICRNYYDAPQDGSVAFDAEFLGTKMFGQNFVPPFVTRELGRWLDELVDFSADGLIDVRDLLYWEQRLGNWGAQYPAEQDIAVDEVSPFNCRLLLHTLLSTARHQRAAPDYPVYSALIREMWPELLEIPINPKSNQAALRPDSFPDSLTRRITRKATSLVRSLIQR